MTLQFETIALWGILGVAIAGLLYAILLVFQILREDEGTKKMIKISGAIRIGANAYLRRQLSAVAILIILLSLFLFLTAPPTPYGPPISWGRALAFLMGAVFSAAVGYIGMNMAARGNVRVAAAAHRSFGDALKIAYRTGTIVGMLTDGLGLLGGTIIYMIYGNLAYEVLLGFGFGGCLLALFMRVGGGIYTKAADVGADLVGKVEKGIPEDDPRNAAVVADQVGDNVGDCAGMAADIFESYEVTIVSAMILGWIAFGPKGVIFPLMVRAFGVLSSIIGTYAVRAKEEFENAMRAISRGYTLSATISILGFVILSYFYMNDLPSPWYTFALATFVGIGLAVVTNMLTEHFTSTEKGSVQEIARSTQTGPATSILSGLAVGLESTVWAIFIIAACIIVSAVIYGFEPLRSSYGIALCGIGLLTLTGNNIAMDTFGPISDNAQGIVEMAGIKDAKVRKVVADLDSVGNTTKAITKSIAIASAVIAAIALFRSYVESTELEGIVVSNPSVFVGMLIGGSIPFLFSSLAIRAVGRASHLIVKEVRRQFNEIKGLWQGEAEPDYAACVDICTRAAQKELVSLGLLSILSPIVVGFILKEEALGGFLAGAILCSQLLAVFMAFSGAAWDNAKKSIEDGLYGGKGSEAHKASVIGDTVGDPLKDTSGPALNPMMKVINLISLIIAPLIIMFRDQTVSIIVALVLVLILGIVIWHSKKESFGM